MRQRLSTRIAATLLTALLLTAAALSSQLSADARAPRFSTAGRFTTTASPPPTSSMSITLLAVISLASDPASFWDSDEQE